MTVLIVFFVNDDRYAQRRWLAVPRVGDEVMLGPNAKEKLPFKVVRVVFGVEADGAMLGEQDVNVEVVRCAASRRRKKA